MTEHAAVIFVFFFLAEYASIILICILISVLFLGGYEIFNIYNISNFNFLNPESTISNNIFELLFSRNNGNDYLIKELLYGLSLSIKSCLLIFAFIWVRASYPRIRFDRLMTYCWTILLPLVIGLIILIPCILYSFDILPSNVLLL
jgi:NADH-ubiquinone oxidoreductase chain 1